MPNREAWLAGLIDGEGCFTIGVSVQHKHSLKFDLRFSISMKKGYWQSTAEEILNSHQIPYHTRERKNQYEIVVNGHKSVKGLIGVLMPHLVVKKPLPKNLANFPNGPARNRFSPIDSSYLNEVCNHVDFVRRFNKGKNRRHKWKGKTIRQFYK